jgi:hypothetical protein
MGAPTAKGLADAVDGAGVDRIVGVTDAQAASRPAAVVSRKPDRDLPGVTGLRPTNG